MQTLAEHRGSSVCSAQSRPDRPRLHDSLCHSTHRNSWRNPDDGFLGGAICVHFRLGEAGSPPQLISLLLGILTWEGLYLRDERLRSLLPIRFPIG